MIKFLGDFRRKRNRALIPIFCKNQKDLHGNPKDIALIKKIMVFAHLINKFNWYSAFRPH